MRLFESSVSYNSTVLSDLLSSQEIAHGSYVGAVEAKLSQMHRAKCAYLYSDMTSALVELLRSIGIGNGSKVAMHSYSCLSTTASVIMTGADVTWIDLDVEGPWLSLAELKKWIDDVDLVINYNIAGYSPNLIALEALCQSRDICLINDCNASFLSKIDNKPIGAFGDYAILSFYPNRPVNGLDGGAIICNSDVTSELGPRKRFGIDPTKYRTDDGEINPKYNQEYITGANSCSNVSAYFISESLKKFDKKFEERTAARAQLEELFPVEKVSALDSNLAPWLFPVRCLDPLKSKQWFSSRHVPSTRLHFPNHFYSAFHSGRNVSSLKNTEIHYASLIWIPCEADAIERIQRAK